MGLAERFRKRNNPRLPNGFRIYAIGDVHGRADLLQSLFSAIDADLNRSKPERAIEVLLGDYVDRGPNSRAVLDLLIERSQTHETVCLTKRSSSRCSRIRQDFRAGVTMAVCLR